MVDETAVAPPKKNRKPKPEASAEEIADKRARSDWTRAKLDMLQAALHDPRMNAKRFRLFAYILQCANYRTRVAVVHDQQIMDELPGFGDDETIRRNRVQIRQIGWLDYLPGRAIRSTVYTPKSDPIEGVMSLIRIKAQARSKIHAYRKEALRAGKETLREQHQSVNEMRGKRRGRSPQNARETPCEIEGITPSLTRSDQAEATGTSQDRTLPMSAETPRTGVVSCPDCGLVAEVVSEPGARCAECQAEALRLDFEIRELPQSEAGGFVCSDCGAVTELAARYKTEPYYPFCHECIAEGEFPDVKQFAFPMSYAEASRGR